MPGWVCGQGNETRASNEPVRGESQIAFGMVAAGLATAKGGRKGGREGEREEGREWKRKAVQLLLGGVHYLSKEVGESNRGNKHHLQI